MVAVPVTDDGVSVSPTTVPDLPCATRAPASSCSPEILMSSAIAPRWT